MIDAGVRRALGWGSVVICGGGIAAGCFFDRPDIAGFAGGSTVALSFLTLFLGSSILHDLDADDREPGPNADPATPPWAAETAPTDLSQPASRADLLALRADLANLRTRVRSPAAHAKEERRLLAFTSVLGTLTWTFGGAFVAALI